MKKHWYDYLWILSLAYLILGFVNILFAWLGLLCFFIPLLIAAIGYNAAASQAGLPQSDFTVQGLETCYIGFQIAAAVLSFLCFTFIWNINDDLRGKIKAWKTGTGPAEYELNK